jgi:hypothetical protein
VKKRKKSLPLFLPPSMGSNVIGGAKLLLLRVTGRIKMEDPLQLALHVLREIFQDPIKAVGLLTVSEYFGNLPLPRDPELEAHDSF